MGVRKDQATLTKAERQRFVDALLALKANGVYDKFVKEHRTAMPPTGSGGMAMKKMAHRNPWFLPWHRDFLRRLELELQKIDSRVSLPYWNWVRDRAKSASIWNEDFMGGDGRSGDGHVTTGQFAFDKGHWPITVQSDSQTDPALRRTLGRERDDSGRLFRLPTKKAVTGALKRTPYDAAPWKDDSPGATGDDFRPELEHVVHDPVHMWVGGTMELATSPNDPVFFLHHANVDRLWAAWHQQHPNEAAYLPVNGGGVFDASKPMPGAGAKPADLIDIATLGYGYDTLAVA